MRSQSNRMHMIELLEDRRLLSVTPTVTALAPIAASPVVVQTTTAVSLVGSYSGSATLSSTDQKTTFSFPATLTIKSQTKTTLSGSIDIGGLGGSGTFTGSIDSKGNFTYKFQF